jgi:anti-sigma factor RsiW
VAETLVDYAFGELEEEEAGQVESHLSGCPVCRSAVLRYRVMQRLARRLPLVSPPDHVLRHMWIEWVRSRKRGLLGEGVDPTSEAC